MCLVTFAVGAHPRYPFVLIANRDERYQRPSAAMHFWDEQQNLLAGKDLEHGGTWLGLTRSGRFATLTNHPFTEWQPKDAVSRGNLVSDYLNGEQSIEDYLASLQSSRHQYEGYHLIFGSILEGKLCIYSNVEDSVASVENRLESVGNTYDDLTMHKKMRSLGMLNGYLGLAASIGVIGDQQAHNLLKDSIGPMRDALEVDDLLAFFQDRVPATNLTILPEQLSLEMARKNSSIFIQGDSFGTVGTTAILIDQSGWVHAKEVRYNQEEVIEISEKQFKLGPSVQSLRSSGQSTNEVNE